MQDRDATQLMSAEERMREEGFKHPIRRIPYFLVTLGLLLFVFVVGVWLTGLINVGLDRAASWKLNRGHKESQLAVQASAAKSAVGQWEAAGYLFEDCKTAGEQYPATCDLAKQAPKLFAADVQQAVTNPAKVDSARRLTMAMRKSVEKRRAATPKLNEQVLFGLNSVGCVSGELKCDNFNKPPCLQGTVEDRGLCFNAAFIKTNEGNFDRLMNWVMSYGLWQLIPALALALVLVSFLVSGDRNRLGRMYRRRFEMKPQAQPQRS